MMSTLEQYLNASGGGQLIKLCIDRFMRDHIAVGFLLRTVKGAELAIHIADVRVVDVPVDDVGDDLVALPVIGIGLGQTTTVIGEGSQFLQRQAVKFQRLFG